MLALDEKYRKLREGGATVEVIQVVLLDELVGRLADLNDFVEKLMPKGIWGQTTVNLTTTEKHEVRFTHPCFNIIVDNDVGGGTDVYVTTNDPGNPEIFIPDTDDWDWFQLVACINSVYIRDPTASGKVTVYWGY